MKSEVHEYSEKRSVDSHAIYTRTHGVLKAVPSCAVLRHRKIVVPKGQVDSQCLFSLQWYTFGAIDRPMQPILAAHARLQSFCYHRRDSMRWSEEIRGTCNMPKQDISDIMEFVPDEDRTEEGTAI